MKIRSLVLGLLLVAGAAPVTFAVVTGQDFDRHGTTMWMASCAT